MNALRPPYRDAVVDLATGIPTRVLQDFWDAVVRSIPRPSQLNVRDFGASGKGFGDDTEALQRAINEGVAIGGSTIVLPPGTYKVRTITKPPGTEPIILQGLGDPTVILRHSGLAAGTGLIDVRGSNFALDSLLIDGAVTAPTGALYNRDFMGTGGNDPMADALTRNTSIWVHGPASGFTCQRVKITHTGGYAVLVDAAAGEITDIRLTDCRFENNRPHLFGVTEGQAIYGSWTGGIYVNGDGRAANPGRVVKRFVMTGCRFLRNTGNCCWQHLYGLDDLHEDFQLIGNYFQDCGLDGILIGGVTGGAVIGNVLRRVGYTTLTDNDRPVPRWLQNLNATAIDSSGIVKNVLFMGNSMLSVNGGCIDLDSHGQSSISVNTCKTPAIGEPEYEEDDIAHSGPLNTGPYSYGLNLNNSSNEPMGAANITVVGNSFLNLRAGAIRLYAGRRCFVTANTIIAPDDSVSPPISFGPVGPGTNQRCHSNKITGNHIYYEPSAVLPAIFEDDTVHQFLASEKNTVYNNGPLEPDGTTAVEFQKAASSGSVVYGSQVWFP